MKPYFARLLAFVALDGGAFNDRPFSMKILLPGCSRAAGKHAEQVGIVLDF